jgi:hypothetical protein
VIDVCLDTVSLIQKRRQPSRMDAHLAGNRRWLTFVTLGELVARRRLGQ